MPELPEVETIRRDLDTTFAGVRVTQVEVEGARTVRRHADPASVATRLSGLRLAGAGRRGKYLLLRFDSPRSDTETLVFHLGMSGQLRTAGPRDPLAKHTHMVLTWERGPQLRFVDPRTFGEAFLAAADPLGSVPELAHIGFDPIDSPPGAPELGRRLARRRTKLKVLLMDQRFVAGIGNIYSDEILWRAGIVHDRPADQLSGTEVDAVHEAMVTTLRDAVRHRGSSLADQQYRDLSGRIGGYQAYHRAYGREGLPCERCGTAITRVKAYGRSTFFCPKCQS